MFGFFIKIKKCDLLLCTPREFEVSSSEFRVAKSTFTWYQVEGGKEPAILNISETVSLK